MDRLGQFPGAASAGQTWMTRRIEAAALRRSSDCSALRASASAAAASPCSLVSHFSTNG